MSVADGGLEMHPNVLAQLVPRSRVCPVLRSPRLPSNHPGRASAHAHPRARAVAWLAVLTAMITFAAVPAWAAAEVQTWRFRVLLDDRPIGYHAFTLSTNGDLRELRSDARFDVRVMWVPLYRYAQDNFERWRGDCLQALVSRTDTNGATQRVNAEAQGPVLVVDRPGGREEHAGCVMSFAYWNPQILSARALLNSQTGELVPVTVARQGEEWLTVQGRRRLAERVRIDAPSMHISTWYADGEWVGLEAQVEGGRRLRYELAAVTPAS